MATTAEAWKERGNDAFRAGEHTRAVEFYSKAIDADPRNAVYWNNRSAAYLKLGKHREAATDAERSAILAPTAKANARHGQALQEQGQYREAQAAFERAARLDPSTESYQASVTWLKQQQQQQQQNAPRTSPTRALPPSARPTAVTLDAVVASCALLWLFGLFVSATLAHYAWKGACLSMLGRQGWTFYHQHEHTGNLKTFGFWKEYAMQRATTEFGGQWSILCVTFLLTGCPGQQFLLLAMVLYAIVDMARDLAAESEALLPDAVRPIAAPTLLRMRESAPQLLMQAAACEAMTLFIAPVSGAPLIATVVTLQFLKWRYRHDALASMAWRALHQSARNVAYHPRSPGIVGRAFDTLAGWIHKAGSM